MGYFVNMNIKNHCIDKTITNIVNSNGIYGVTRIIFSDGSSLNLRPTLITVKKECGCQEELPTIITTPYKPNGEVEMA